MMQKKLCFLKAISFIEINDILDTTMIKFLKREIPFLMILTDILVITEMNFFSLS